MILVVAYASSSASEPTRVAYAFEGAEVSAETFAVFSPETSAARITVPHASSVPPRAPVESVVGNAEKDAPGKIQRRNFER